MFYVFPMTQASLCSEAAELNLYREGNFHSDTSASDAPDLNHEALAWRNRLSAESWPLGDDNLLGSLGFKLWGETAWLSGLVATLALLPE